MEFLLLEPLPRLSSFKVEVEVAWLASCLEPSNATSQVSSSSVKNHSCPFRLNERPTPLRERGGSGSVGRKPGRRRKSSRRKKKAVGGGCEAGGGFVVEIWISPLPSTSTHSLSPRTSAQLKFSQKEFSVSLCSALVEEKGKKGRVEEP